MKKKTKYIVVTLFIGLMGVASIGWIVTDYISDMLSGSTNARDNSSAVAREDMVSTSCEWGRLADLPASKNNFDIKTEGNSFTRSFRGSFNDTSAVIQQWLLDSPGVQEGVEELMPDGSTKYELKMGGGATYGEVIVSGDKERVKFYICWS